MFCKIDRVALVVADNIMSFITKQNSALLVIFKQIFGFENHLGLGCPVSR